MRHRNRVQCSIDGRTDGPIVAAAVVDSAAAAVVGLAVADAAVTALGSPADDCPIAAAVAAAVGYAVAAIDDLVGCGGGKWWSAEGREMSVLKEKS